MGKSVDLVGAMMRTDRLPTGRRRLVRNLGLDVEDRRFTVRRSSQTDFSTIPFFGRWVVRWSKVDIAGVIHDVLYHDGSLSRAQADRVWRLVASSGEHSANAVQAWVCWVALRLGGWLAWNSYRRRERRKTNVRSFVAVAERP